MAHAQTAHMDLRQYGTRSHSPSELHVNVDAVRVLLGQVGVQVPLGGIGSHIVVSVGTSKVFGHDGSQLIRLGVSVYTKLGSLHVHDDILPFAIVQLVNFDVVFLHGEQRRRGQQK